MKAQLRRLSLGHYGTHNFKSPSCRIIRPQITGNVKIVLDSDDLSMPMFVGTGCRNARSTVKYAISRCCLEKCIIENPSQSCVNGGILCLIVFIAFPAAGTNGRTKQTFLSMRFPYAISSFEGHVGVGYMLNGNESR
jgi:hypothetical protein